MPRDGWARRGIATPEDYREALAELWHMWGSSPGTPEGDEFDVLADALDKYEEEKWPSQDTREPPRRGPIMRVLRGADHYAARDRMDLAVQVIARPVGVK